MSKPKFLNVNNFESEKHRHGKACEIIGHVLQPNDDFDLESLPVFKIRFIDSGEEYTASPEEIDEKFHTPEMKAFLSGEVVS